MEIHFLRVKLCFSFVLVLVELQLCYLARIRSGHQTAINGNQAKVLGPCQTKETGPVCQLMHPVASKLIELRINIISPRCGFD